MYNIKHVLINLFVIGKALVNRILVIVLGESKSYMQIFDCVWVGLWWQFFESIFGQGLAQEFSGREVGILVESLRKSRSG